MSGTQNVSGTANQSINDMNQGTIDAQAMEGAQAKFTEAMQALQIDSSTNTARADLSKSEGEDMKDLSRA
ncbi:hypothetical protein C0Z18_18255 [Trinickia dabaoshanensis]|uniref:Uncharacterized protein n=1 Tax=Trinickia dabaoshanensis TaxID=564714 RepID=A0A2N7VM17_9BURK|nr:hypothetical protein [Trinickia dabaoshanensis]PMS18167.1 hypothetical protein C0Z18_18255 [Trinickia dabaoshanensis]